MYLDVINQWSTHPLGVCFCSPSPFLVCHGVFLVSFISSLPHYLKALGAPDCGDFPSSQCGFPVWPRRNSSERWFQGNLNSACFDKNSGWSGLIQPLTFKFCLQLIPRFTFRSFWSWQPVFGFLWDPSLTTFFKGYIQSVASWASWDVWIPIPSTYSRKK